VRLTPDSNHGDTFSFAPRLIQLAKKDDRMRSVVTQDYGSAPTVAELDTPTAGAGEIRIKVRGSSLNGFDNALALGFFRGIMEHQFPVTLGRDFAGTIDQIGEGVTAFAPGDDVFGVVLTQPLSAGGFAEYLVVPEDHFLVRIPDGVDHMTAGAGDRTRWGRRRPAPGRRRDGGG
jgi:NADPH2:quinone reductase